MFSPSPSLFSCFFIWLLLCSGLTTCRTKTGLPYDVGKAWALYECTHYIRSALLSLYLSLYTSGRYKWSPRSRSRIGQGKGVQKGFP
ncbi:hypothetical protein F5Y04DRAFT_241048 [Hypomontagnella monticulosa]|nr:hypothetical protein F5Y04DRAFT_241048 [Hypomontagnella monticulosa]